LPSVAPEQEDALEVEDLHRQYRDAVQHLTPRTREVFILHRVDELTYTEIAARLGISVSTVEYHIMRALVHLDEALRR
jgi:RNA polymerase sigma-70 factor (ECF subfamily)